MNDHDKGDTPGSKQDYDVGYGRPPRWTQFKPGQSGNPKGRKRKPKSVQAQVQSVLAKRVKINEGGKTKSLPIQDVIIRSIANNAAKGELKAATFLFNLLRTPEFAETDTINPQIISSEDQAMLDGLLKRFTDTNDTQQRMDPDQAAEVLTQQIKDTDLLLDSSETEGDADDRNC